MPLLHSAGLGDSHFFGRGTAECNETGEKFPAFVLEDPLSCT